MARGKGDCRPDTARGLLRGIAPLIAALLLPEGRFMVIHRALALPRGRPAGAAYLSRFVEEMKASGFVAEALRRHGIEGATPAPPAAQ